MQPQQGLNFCVADSEGLDLSLEKTHLEDVIELDDTFVAVSENGLIVSRRAASQSRPEETWKSVLPGAFVNIRLC